MSVCSYGSGRDWSVYSTVTVSPSETLSNEPVDLSSEVKNISVSNTPVSSPVSCKVICIPPESESENTDPVLVLITSGFVSKSPSISVIVVEPPGLTLESLKLISPIFHAISAEASETLPSVYSYDTVIPSV